MRGVCKLQVGSHCIFVLVVIGRHKCQSNTLQFKLGLFGPHLIDDQVDHISGSEDSKDEMDEMEDEVHNAEMARRRARESSV